MAELLVLAAGRRRYVVEALMDAKGANDVLLVADQDRQTPGLSVPGTTVLVEPSAKAASDAWLRELCDGRRIDALLSLHDYQALRLSDSRDDLASRGCRWIGPSGPSARTLLSKKELAAFLSSYDAELAIPTFDASDVLPDDGSEWVVKDDLGSGSSGLQLRISREDAKAAVLANTDLIAQPLVRGEEWNLDFFVWPGGYVDGVSAKRKFRMRDGETDAAEVVPESQVPFDFRPVIDALSAIDHLGNVDVDVFVGPGALKVIDVNPRFGGGYAFSMQAGYDAAAAVWDLANHRDEPRRLEATRGFKGAKSIEVVSL